MLHVANHQEVLGPQPLVATSNFSATRFPLRCLGLQVSNYNRLAKAVRDTIDTELGWHATMAHVQFGQHAALVLEATLLRPSRTRGGAGF